MKKILASICTLLTLTSFACWFTESNFNTNYIASINNSAKHYLPSDNINNATYFNGSKVSNVALPLTVQIKISERNGDQINDSTKNPIIKAILQYKIVRFDMNGNIKSQTQFKTVKTLDNPKWNMSFSEPVNLFGKTGIININDNEISKGDGIIIRLYLSDGIYQSGDLNSDIQWNDIPDEINQTLNNIEIGEDGWSAPFVFKVIFSGTRRIII